MSRRGNFKTRIYPPYPRLEERRYSRSGDGDIDNTATADSNQTDPVTDSAAVPIAQSASLSIDKTATVPGDLDGVIDSPSDDISYSIVVTNTGNQTLTGVEVSDPRITNLDCDRGPPATRPPASRSRSGAP
jgi:hypothetical protein